MTRYGKLMPMCLGGLILAAAPAAAATKTAQECYKQDHYWTVACSNLEGPQQLRDDCYAAGDTRLGRCLDSVGKTSDVGTAGPDLPATHVIERAPLGGKVLDPAATQPRLHQRAPAIQGGTGR